MSILSADARLTELVAGERPRAGRVTDDSGWSDVTPDYAQLRYGGSEDLLEVALQRDLLRDRSKMADPGRHGVHLRHLRGIPLVQSLAADHPLTRLAEADCLHVCLRASFGLEGTENHHDIVNLEVVVCGVYDGQYLADRSASIKVNPETISSPAQARDVIRMLARAAILQDLPAQGVPRNIYEKYMWKGPVSQSTETRTITATPELWWTNHLFIAASHEYQARALSDVGLDVTYIDRVANDTLLSTTARRGIPDNLHPLVPELAGALMVDKKGQQRADGSWFIAQSDVSNAITNATQRCGWASTLDDESIVAMQPCVDHLLQHLSAGFVGRIHRVGGAHWTIDAPPSPGTRRIAGMAPRG